ncbi:MAG: sulfatase family protein [Gemmataceae bacterium]
MKAIVFVVRGLQLGALGCYGNQWIDTPALDSLAAEGVVFDRHFADNADPAGARRAWRSGRYHFPPGSNAAAAAADVLAALGKQGIHTCLIVDDSRPSPPDFAEGWDAVERIAVVAEQMPLDATLEAVGVALERLEKRNNWLLWIDLATLRMPWNVPAEIVEAYFAEESESLPLESGEEETDPLPGDRGSAQTRAEVPDGIIDGENDYLYLNLQTSYAAAVTYVDAAIGQLLEALDGLDGGDDILLLVTTDVGQDLGEHGIVGTCRPWLHDELIHLPLLLRLPARAEAGRRVAALTQALDLAPTLADWFRTPLADVHGHSLLPLARGETESIREYACAGRQVGDALEYALRTPEWAFILPVHPPLTPPARGEGEGEVDVERAPQLYVKPDDRWEVNNVLQHHLELAEQLERTLRDFVTATRTPSPRS